MTLESEELKLGESATAFIAKGSISSLDNHRPVRYLGHMRGHLRKFACSFTLTLAALAGSQHWPGTKFEFADGDAQWFTEPDSPRLWLTYSNQVVFRRKLSIVPGHLAPGSINFIPDSVFSIGPSSAFPFPVKLGIGIDPEKVPVGVKYTSLTMYKVVNHRWIPVPDSSVDLGRKLVIGTIDGSGTYGIRFRLTYEPPEGAIYFRKYGSGDPNIYRVTPTSESVQNTPQALAAFPSIPGHLVISPTRDTVYEVARNPVGFDDIRMWICDGSRPIWLTNAKFTSIQEMVAFPDGRSLLLRGTYGTTPGIYRVYWDGKISPIKAGTFTAGPSLSGSGARFCVATASNVQVYSLNGTLALNWDTGGGAVVNYLSLSHSGTLALAGILDNPSMYALDIQAKTGNQLPTFGRLSSDGKLNLRGAWAPDDKTIAAPHPEIGFGSVSFPANVQLSRILNHPNFNKSWILFWE